MAAHSSILAWRIPWTEEAGGLQLMGSRRVGHDWSSAHTHSHVLSEGWAWTLLPAARLGEGSLSLLTNHGIREMVG